MDKTPFSSYSTGENEFPPRNEEIPAAYDLNPTDTSWILLCAFIIFTMQIGFGLLEAGLISTKNQVNIMMKNIADVVLGGITYWIFGFGMSYGKAEGTNPFIAFGYYLFDPDIKNPTMGGMYTSFLFQLSFATTATTIVSGAMAERCNFKAYCLFSLINTVVYCVPAGWVWGEHGFLYKLGVIDIAGSGPVHLIGGASALAAAIMLGPRLGRYKNGTKPLQPGSPLLVCHGFLILWLGWLAFNSGSTYGVTGDSWKYCARASVMTMLASFGGGLASIAYSMTMHNGKLDMMEMINGILGALVGVTAGCFIFNAWSSIIVGIIGALLAILVSPIFDKLRVDDPVGATTVHGVCGIWGVIAVGLFAENVSLGTTNDRTGLFIGGGWYLLGVQSLAALCLSVWGAITTFIILFLIDKITPLRMDEHEELLGADYAEHNIKMEGCQCCCSSTMSRKDTNGALEHGTSLRQRNVSNNIFDEIGSKREKEFKKDGFDNQGYEGKFTMRETDVKDSQLERNQQNDEAV